MLYNIWLLACNFVTLSVTAVSNIVYFSDNLAYLKAWFDEQNLTLTFISYEIYETRQRVVS